MAFARDEDSDVEGVSEDCEEDVAAEDVASAEADVDCRPWAVPLFDVAVVTVAAEDPPAAPPPPAPPAPIPGCPWAIPIPCPFLARAELWSLERSVFVLLAAVTSAASLPTRTVQGADWVQCKPPKVVSRISISTHSTSADMAPTLTQGEEQRAARSLRKFIGAE